MGWQTFASVFGTVFLAEIGEASSPSGYGRCSRNS